MDTTWLVVSLLLISALGIVVVLWQKALRAADENQKRLQKIQHKAETQAQRIEELATRECLSSFSSLQIYKLLTKSRFDSPTGGKTCGVVTAQSGTISAFIIDESMDHLEANDCFCALSGRLAKVDPGAFESSPGTSQPVASDPPAPESTPTSTGGTQTTAAQGAASPPSPAAPSDEGAARTALFVAADIPDLPVDPTVGLPYFKVLSGNDEDTIFHVPFGKATLGREQDNDICLDDAGASRVHCEVAYTQNRFLLRDNNSTNGTIHNGTKIDKTWLEFGDKIQVADTELIFSCEGYDLKDDNPEKAIETFESSLKREPDFLDALKILAFLLERNVARRKEAAALWDKISQLEKSSAL